ncbi:hypothetical protein RJ639_017584 [Escallonia herrerae]|uniref:Uncharacterized protein n=1 Tax=Escallonia herrerae TaxID=1293975 RepID=A0AA89ALC0_9ASTE|nr:hypothetical protein RJ639_017584 [Escallonia herrerae]
MSRTSEQRSLATHFLLSEEENRLFEIFDPRVLKEGTKEELIAVANLARRCLNVNGKNRPAMKEVATELEGIGMSNKKSSTVQTNFQELGCIGGVESVVLSYDNLAALKPSPPDVFGAAQLLPGFAVSWTTALISLGYTYRLMDPALDWSLAATEVGFDPAATEGIGNRPTSPLELPYLQNRGYNQSEAAEEFIEQGAHLYELELIK